MSDIDVASTMERPQESRERPRDDCLRPPRDAAVEIISQDEAETNADPGSSAPVPRTEIIGTILVPLHNHGRFIARALEAIIAAWRPGFELLLLDDASTDDGFAVARGALAAHPEIPVTMARTGRTLGMGNAATIVRLARGRFIVQCDSDDMVLPDRFDAIADCFARDPTCRLVTSNAVTISAEDLPLGLFDTRTRDHVFDDPSYAAARVFDPCWLGATAAYHRDLFDSFPPFDAELCPYGLDLLTPFRALLRGTHHYISRPLLRYRLHAGNAHRTAGAYAETPWERERYEALEMMVLAQKLRDLDAEPAKDARTRELVEIARRTFFTKFDAWSRLCIRARSGGAAQAASTQAASTQAASTQAASTQGAPTQGAPTKASFVPAVAPIATLHPGEAQALGEARFAAIAAQWSGVYGPEAWGCWLHPCALIVLRLAGARRKGLCVEVHGNTFAGPQRVSIRAGTGPWLEASLGVYERRRLTIDLPPCAEDAPLVPLVIVSHDAAVPNDAGDAMNDDRLLGIGLRSIELV